jgi:L-Ala-D/L-Glu epimerase
MRQLEATSSAWPLRETFTIARGSKTHAHVVSVTVRDGPHQGQGECVPYARYGESLDSVLGEIEHTRSAIEAGATRQELQSLLPPGAARNAMDCALWDLEAKQAGTRAWALEGLAAPAPCTTAFTLSLQTPEAMEAAARAASARPLLKIKLGGPGDMDRLEAVRRGAPQSRLIVDANEGWTPSDLPHLLRRCAALGVDLIEQPLPAGQDDALIGLHSPVPMCADESAHATADLAQLLGKYQVVNIKLDKTGGLTEALAMARQAQTMGFGLMIGCMVGTSLAMAPAMLLTPGARFVDLDGPLLLASDRATPMPFEGSLIGPPPAQLWG